MQTVAILQAYNEQRFIGNCLDHLAAQGISVYLVDNESTDETVALAERRLSGNLIGIESLPREGTHSQRLQLARKEELAQSLDADWFLHVDADEFRVSPKPRHSLAQAIAEVDEAGFNALNFLEFTFMPTREAPDHDHADFLQTLRSYYPFLPGFPHRLTAWKRQDGPVDLSKSGGHRVSFTGLRMAPTSMYSRHYLCLSAAHAARKFKPGGYARDEVAAGWFGWRDRVDPSMIRLPRECDLRHYVADDLLDPSNPRKRHIAEEWASPRKRRAAQAKRVAKRGYRRARALGKPRSST